MMTSFIRMVKRHLHADVLEVLKKQKPDTWLTTNEVRGLVSLRRTGVKLSAVSQALRKLQIDGLIERSGERTRSKWKIKSTF
jgi:DNA-binding MarR family transcriptional regulator